MDSITKRSPLSQKLLHGLQDPKLFVSAGKSRLRWLREELYISHLKRRLISKNEFIEDVRLAVENETGYAAGKLGVSQKFWMYYEIIRRTETNPAKIADFEGALKFHGLKQCGIFPADPSFYVKFNRFYQEHVRNLDCVGLFLQRPELEIIRHYRLQNKFVHFPDQEPDRSIPSDESRCYLKYFKDKRVLIVCPFAELLKERATKEVFEGVWSKTGKKWFYPQAVDAVELPYGFSEETQRRYGSAIDLFYDITSQIDKREFDIALIAASGLAIPIASHVKNVGKIAIDLGGHLQILFGVLGKRWRQAKDWDSLYFNDWWIDMPSKYRPKERDVCDKGAYW